MKKLLLTAFAAAALLQAKAQTFTHAVVPVTGFTADVIADGTGPAATSTTADVDGQNYNFVAQNYKSPTNVSPTTFLPATGSIISAVTPGLPFQLAPYTGNNSLRLTTTTSTGTLTFTTPRSADKLTVLVTTANPSTFTATVNFTDATTQAFTGNAVPNWFDGASPAIQGISRVLKTTDVIENSTTNPRMYQYVLTLSAVNAAKTIQSITFTKTTTVANEVLHIFAVSASTAIPNDAGVSAITAPVSPIAPNVSQAVSVTVKNYGANPLASATIGWSVNKVVQPTFAYTATTPLATNAVSPAVSIGNFSFPFGSHKIKAWTKQPNGVLDINAVNDTSEVTIFSCTPLTGSLTINKNLAASATNFPSFALAVQALTSCGVGGPVTFTVAPNSGPYNEQVTLPVIAGTSATNTITFEGSGNTFTAATSTAKPGVIILNGADYVKINNFKIEVDVNMPWGFGVQLLNASDNNTISNCTVNFSLSSTALNFGGIFCGTTSTATGNFANNLLIENNTINGGYFGVFLAGISTGTATSGNRILGNKIRDHFGYGIYLHTAGTGTLVEGNDISRANRVNGGAFYGIFLSNGASTNTIISKNRIHNTHDKTVNTANFVYGIYSLSAATVGNENIIKNNLIYNINNHGGSLTAFYNSSAHNTWYFYNTVAVEDPNLALNVVKGIHFTAASTNVKFINNILSLPVIAGTKHAIYVANTSIQLVSNNNDYFIGNAGNVGYYTADKTTLADWKLVNTAAYDQNSISADPVFANPTTYLRPLVAALDNGGQPIPGITDDFAGTIRSTTTPDMGAYEFTPAANDAGVTLITTPTSPVTPGSHAVNVRLKNFGSAVLNTATISWSVNGAAQADHFWTGPLASQATTLVPVNIGSFNFVSGNYLVKVWSKNPNGVADPLAANDTTILNVFACAPLAGNFTINKNNPTAGTNFQSINEAAQKLNSCGVAGPVTFTVAPNSGPYNEQVELGIIPFTSATNTVTFEGSGNTISATPVGKPGIVIFNGADFVKLNNFVITLPATATNGWGIQLINFANDNTISNNIINLPLTLNSSDVNGIVAGTVVQTAGSNASNTKVLNNTINGGFNGIQLNGVAGGTYGNNNQIVGNQIKDFYSYGIYILNNNGNLIENNDISRPARTNGSTLFGIYLNGTSMSTIISKNRIHNFYDAQTTGLASSTGIYTLAPATAGNENIIKNNAVYNMVSPSVSFTGLYNGGGNGTWYYHNTIMSDPTITYSFMRAIWLSSASTNVKFINNIISMPGNSTTKYAIYLSVGTTPLTSNNNVLYIGTAPNGYTAYAGSNLATLADWKAFNSGAFDQNSVATDPVITGAATGNLKPTATTLDNLGQPVPAVIDDILGANRSTTTPDMGAFEFGAVTDDAGITAITGPNSGCGLTNAETITVTIKNNGPAALAFVPVSYTINGGTAVNEIYTGTLAPNATVNYSFTTKANLATAGSYAIVASANLVNDVLATNNSFTKTVVASASAAVPTITVGGSTAICTGGSVTLTAASTTTGATFAWFNNGTAITGATSTTYTANAAGNYTVTATANGCTATSVVTAVTVNAAPATPTISQSGFVLTSSSATGNQWYLNGTPITGATGAIYTATAIGTYTVIVTTNGCSSTASAAVNIVSMGIKNGQQIAVSIYPNPSEGLVNVTLPKNQAYEVQVTDLTGKVILTEKVTADKTLLNLSKAAKGIYLLKVSGENSSAVRKLVVE